jgi:hypothetical protein
LDIAAFVLARESAVSYLTPYFNPDVFVSYSHGDPLGGRAPLRDWTQALIRRLNDRLHALETEFDDLHIWMDPEIDPTAYLTPELRAKAGECGVLMIVMSKRYLKSSWCERELEWFKEQIQEDPNDDYFKALGRLQTWLVKRLREQRARAAKRAQAEAAAAAPPRPTLARRVYLHVPPDGESVRVEISRALASDGIVPVTAPLSAVRGKLADWQREATERIDWAKRCEALALVRVDDGERFRDDLLDIGVDERERIAGARGAPMPCAVLDKTGAGLPIDVGLYGIERFDINRTDWRSEFRNWLDSARVWPMEASP